VIPESLGPCFQGVIPALISTCDRGGEPNVTYLSQVHYVDSGHVALSCQFFNKTRRNVDENPFATVIVHDPITLDAWRLRLRFERSETEGDLFERMAMRIEVIASHTGMTGIFRLRSADLYEVLSVEPVEGFLLPADASHDAHPAEPPPGPRGELRSVQSVSARIAACAHQDRLLGDALAALDELLGFSHSMILVPEESGRRLVAVCSRGYAASAVGRTIEIGKGAIGAAAEHRRMIRVGAVPEELRYGRAIRERLEECGERDRLEPQMPLPGLPDAQVQLALPLLSGNRLMGVLAVESRDPLGFDEWDEAFLQILGNQIAAGMERTAAGPAGRNGGAGEREFVFYRNDDCMFSNGEYLIRHLPGRILRKLLDLNRREGRTEFSNRELRLDPTLGLPPIKDNLEARLILLRRRLEEKDVGIRIVPSGRGRFELVVDAEYRFVERDSAG